MDKTEGKKETEGDHTKVVSREMELFNEGPIPWNKFRSEEKATTPNLSYEVFGEKNLSEFNLTGTILRGVDLSNCKGLTITQLANCDLSGAKLPEGLDFSILKQIEDQAKSSNSALKVLILVCIFSIITVFNNTDAQILIDSSSINIPVINTSIKIFSFLSMVPPLILIMYFACIISKIKCAQIIMEIPAIFPDGFSHVFKNNSWIMGELTIGSRKMSSFLSILVTVAVYSVAPITILLIWLRLIMLHNIGIFIFNYLLMIICVMLGATLYDLWLSSVKNNIRNLICYIFWPLAILSQAMFVYSICTKSDTPRKLWNWDVNLENSSLSKDNIPYNANLERIGSTKLLRIKAKDLRRLNAKNVTAIRIKFHGTNLQMANFSEADLRGSIFSSADLRSAKFGDSRMEGVVFDNAQINGVYFTGANLQRATFSGEKKIMNAYFYQANLIDADFSNLELRSTEFSGAILHRANFSKAKLTDVIFRVKGKYKGADLQGAIFNHTKIEGAQFQMTLLTEVKMVNVELVKSNLNMANLNRSKIFNSHFKGGSLEHAQIKNSLVQGSTFHPESILDEINFEGSEISGCDFIDVQAQKSIFAYSILYKTSFKGAKLRDSNFSHAIIVNSCFCGADLRGSNITHAQLENANVSNDTTLPDGTCAVGVCQCGEKDG